MNKRAIGQSLQLFFIDGKPDGMLTAEVFGWTGHILMVPRTQISEGLIRKEAAHTGVYLLYGQQEAEPRLYIGESDDISERIRSHDAKKDWWDTAVLITTAANSLNKAHVRYIEARLVEEARGIGKAVLENGNSPARGSLTEADQANMEAFIEKILVVLPAIRIDIFLQNTRPQKAVVTPQADEVPEFDLVTPKHNISAVAKMENGEFVVQAGSIARSAWEGTPSHAYARLFDELVREGVLVVEGDHRVFSANYAFNSPSAAGAVINGRATNGQGAWKLRGTSKTYREWESERLETGRHL